MAATAAAPEPRDWLLKQLQVMRASDRDVIALLKSFRDDVNRMLRQVDGRPGVGALVRQQQLLLIKRNLQREQAKLWRSLGDIVRARRLEAASRSINLAKALDTFLLVAGKVRGGRAIAEKIAQAELAAAERVMDRLIARLVGSSYIPLSQVVYNSEVAINGAVDRLVNSAIARGLSAREFALEARPYINPFTPGGVQYAAMRLARTEINNAAHAVAVDAQRDKPWVTGMRWHLSGSHPRPDVCDQLAKGSNGKGIYETDAVPAKPHPHCFCFVTPETVDEAQFLDNLVGGQYNSYLERYRNLQPGELVTTKLG
jgi:hypothetical protein